MDPLKPSSMPVIGGLLNTVNTGVSIATGVVDKAITAAKASAGNKDANSSDKEGGVAYV